MSELPSVVLTEDYAAGGVGAWFVESTSRNSAEAGILPRAPKAIRGVETVALNGECRAQEERQFATPSATVNIEDLLIPAVCDLLYQVEEELRQDAEDACDGDDVAPNPDAIAICMQLARCLAPHVALAPRLKWGAFTEDTGGVSLVLQSLVTDRRINCRIQPGGSAISVVRVNEHMVVDTIPISLTSPDVGRELAEWVTRRV